MIKRLWVRLPVSHHQVTGKPSR